MGDVILIIHQNTKTLQLPRSRTISKNPVAFKNIGAVWVAALLFFGNTVSAVADPVRGKWLFKGKACALCHNIGLPGTEFKLACPGLLGVKKRHRRDWLRKWLADPAAVWRTNDLGIQSINRRYFAFRGSKPHPRESFMATVIGKTVHLTEAEIEDIIDYLMTL